MNIIYTSSAKPINKTPFEIVERKGLGHPDTLADGIAEKISIEYSKYCLDNFGAILHHNLDKVSIIGGLVDIDFGRGDMLRPVNVVVNGRMSIEFAGRPIDIKGLQTQTIKQYIKKVLPHMDVENWLEIQSFTNQYSHNPFWYYPRDLNDLPEIKRPYANDTSTCTGYWPQSVLERVTLALEGYFYVENDKPRYSFIGQDIKVMAVRSGNDISVTMCVPFISRETPDAMFYKDNRQKIKGELLELAHKVVGTQYDVNLYINTLDDDEKKDYYILLTGSCLEAGEEGVVGRGNRSGGIISSTRPYSMEASNGKNPVYFVGKVHTVIADEVARVVAETFDCECNVFISTRNGENLFDPSTIIVETSRKIPRMSVQKVVETIFAKRDWTQRILNEELLVPKSGGYYLR